MNPKEIIKKYHAVGYVQIFPSLICLAFLLWTSIIAIVFTFSAPLYRGNANNFRPDSYVFIRLGIFFLIVSFLVFGLISFLISSYQFIKSKKHSDYGLIVKGMVHLNRAWVILTLFTIIMTVFTSYGLYSIITIGYF